jgi:hypothetical protein
MHHTKFDFDGGNLVGDVGFMKYDSRTKSIVTPQDEVEVVMVPEGDLVIELYGSRVAQFGSVSHSNHVGGCTRAARQLYPI